jgi:hypothetical protein
MKFITDLSKGVIGQADSVEMWEEIIANIPDEVLLKPGVRILIVACGHGTEAVLIAKRMIALGISKESVRESIWLIDKYSVFTNYVKLNYGFTNVVTADFLEWKTDMVFDVVGGNPPYKFEGNNSFYIKFIEKSRSLLKEDGQFHFVIPNRFLSPTSKASKALAGWLDVSYVMPTVDHYFPGIGTSIGVVGGVKKSESVFKKVPFIFPDGTISRSLSSPTPIVNSTLISTKIISKIVDSDFERLKIVSEFSKKDYVFVEKSYCRYRSTTSRGGEKTLVTHVNNKNGRGSYIDCDSESEARLISWFLSRSRVGRFVIYSFANAAFVESSSLHHGFMPKIPSDISYSDEDIYKLFDLSSKEIEHIESIMK